MWSEWENSNYTASLQNDLLQPRFFKSKQNETRFTIKWNKLWLTLLNTLVPYQHVHIILKLNEASVYFLQEIFNLVVRGFIEVHVVTFLCLYETRVSPISARSVLSYIFSRQNQHEEQRAPVATYSTKIHSENLRFSFLLVAVWQRSCYETSVTNWSGFMNCFLEMRCKDNFNMSKWLFLIYFVWASTFLMSTLKRTIYQKPKRKQPEYVYQNA